MTSRAAGVISCHPRLAFHGGYMKKLLVPIFGLVAWGLTGCVVGSLEPWLGAQTVLKENTLAGAWCDAKPGTDVTGLAFESLGSGLYALKITNKRGETLSYEAQSGKIGKQEVLQISPVEAAGKISPFAVLPLHLLAQVRRDQDTVALHLLNVDKCREVVRTAGLLANPEAAKNGDAVIILAPEEKVQAFIAKNGENKDLFEAVPIYILKRPEASGAATK